MMILTKTIAILKKKIEILNILIWLHVMWPWFYSKTGAKNLRQSDYIYACKTKGQQSHCYVCKTPKCYVSISLAASEVFLEEPFVVTCQKPVHKEGCKPMDEEFFRVSEFLLIVKKEIDSNPLIPIRQIERRYLNP